MTWASDKSEGPHDYTGERWAAEDEAVRKGWPINRAEEAEARGYAKGDES